VIGICAESLLTELRAGSSVSFELRVSEAIGGSQHVVGKKLWVGIDVGELFHHVRAVDGRGGTVFSRRVKNRRELAPDRGHRLLCGGG
jgi:hypothetical protein